MTKLLRKVVLAAEADGSELMRVPQARGLNALQRDPIHSGE